MSNTETKNAETTRRRFICTAEMHEKLSRVLASVGKHEDSAAAAKAARLCRESAARV